jgi:DNA-binding transcriptional MerR regulator
MKIGQLSKETKLSTYTIRFYEKIGLLQRPSKDQSGHRIYDENDVELINWIACLKNSGMSLNKIKEYSYAFRFKENNKLAELLAIHLVKLKSQSVDIAHYIDVTEEKLKRLKNT